MFIPFEFFLIILAVVLLGRFIVYPAIKPLLGKNWADKQLEDAEEKHRQAQKLLKAAELQAKALEAEVKADEIRENALNDKLK